MNGHRLRMAQTLTEYAIIVLVVASVLIGMQLYMKRGIQAVIKHQADQLGPQQVVINKGLRQDSSTNSASIEYRGDTREKEVFLGGRQSVDATSTVARSGSSNTVTTVDWNPSE
jgi:hypothetical protein